MGRSWDPGSVSTDCSLAGWDAHELADEEGSLKHCYTMSPLRHTMHFYTLRFSS